MRGMIPAECDDDTGEGGSYTINGLSSCFNERIDEHLRRLRPIRVR